MAEQRPLSDVRVIDMATIIAGPCAARHLADFGADVIKVEAPGGDATRRLGWTEPGGDDSYFWKLAGRGKRSIVLELKHPQGREAMLRLVDTADVFVENMRPGKLERLGLAPNLLHERNRRLVILRVTGFGQSGPYASRPAFATLIEAMSGLSAISGLPDEQPLLPPIPLTDEVTGILGAFSVMGSSGSVLYGSRPAWRHLRSCPTPENAPWFDRLTTNQRGDGFPPSRE
jgi:crotonobetainyl-CoA:carnitine CoA-transferase CaiB-like acyl-CoA transferase